MCGCGFADKTLMVSGLRTPIHNAGCIGFCPFISTHITLRRTLVAAETTPATSLIRESEPARRRALLSQEIRRKTQR